MDSSSSSDRLRIIDANANRAREGIRTTEDYIRFALGNGRWSRQLKSIRHAITAILQIAFAGRSLIGSRSAGSDLGRPEDAPNTDAEPHIYKESSKEVAQRGAKRAQEALRVLEEYLRAEQPAASLQLSRHRYELYEAEQWLLGPGDAARILASAQVYVLLTESLCKQGLITTAEAVLRGGAKVLQLREKDQTDHAYLAQARNLRVLCDQFGSVLICNDRVDLALSADAPGVHLGQNDLSVLEARQVAGEKLLIGRSTHSVEQARYAAESERADYIAIGALYETSTKRGRVLIGLNVAAQVFALRLEIPVYAIGGITHGRVGELKAAGVNRIAVSSAIILDRDPETATKRMIEAMAS